MNEVTIYNEVIDYLAEELYSTWHPEKPDGFQLELNPNYEHEKSLEHHDRRHDYRYRSRRAVSC